MEERIGLEKVVSDLTESVYQLPFEMRRPIYTFIGLSSFLKKLLKSSNIKLIDVLQYFGS